MKAPLPKHYHRDWYRKRAEVDPQWNEKKKATRSDLRRAQKSKFVKKMGGCCAHCKQVYPDCVFEFHHINHAEKDITPSKLFMYRDEVIAKELAKCLMLCANCHRIVHHHEGYAAHGKRVDGVVIPGNQS